MSEKYTCYHELIGGCGIQHRTRTAAENCVNARRYKGIGRDIYDVSHMDDKQYVEEFPIYSPTQLELRMRLALQGIQGGGKAKEESAAPDDGGLGLLDKAFRSAIREEVGSFRKEFEDKADEISRTPPPKFLVQIGDQEPIQIDERPHNAFDRCLKMCQWRDIDGNRLNVALVGPSGSGKTTLARQVAKALGLPFYTLSLTSGVSESKLLGRIVPSQTKAGLWEFLPPEFVQAFKHGGVWLGDEYDAADENMALALNQPLSNGFLSLPDCKDEPIVQRHKDFIAIVGMNTYGAGADRIYVGRNAQDGASIDRWTCGTIEVDYDKDLERALVKSVIRSDKDAETWLNMCWKARKQLRQKNLRRIISTRNIVNIACTHIAQGGATPKEAFKQLTIGWSEHDRKVVGG